MPTSSIFENIIINDPEKAEKFINALDASSHDSVWKPETQVAPPLTDAEEIQKLMAKRKESLNESNTRKEETRWHRHWQ